MRITLAKVNRLKGSEVDSEIPALYERWQAETREARERDDRERQDAAARRLREITVGSLRRSIEALGGTPPADADEEQLRALYAPLKAAAVQRQRAETEQAERYRRQRAEWLFRQSGCPNRHVLNLDRIDAGKVPKWAEFRNLLVDQAGYANGYLIALLGPRGTGKTEMGVSVIHDCCGRLLTCRYVKALDLFRDLRRAFTPVARGERGESERDVIEEWARLDLLVIDELHQRGESEFENNTLVNLLDRRYDARRCTILIANQSKSEFAAAMGDSVVSRIHETGDALICDWQTFRDRRDGGWRQAAGSEVRRPSGDERREVVARRIDR